MKINSKIWTIGCILSLINPWLGGSANSFDKYPPKAKFLEKSIFATRENARHFTGVDLVWEQYRQGSQPQYKVTQDFNLTDQLPQSGEDVAKLMEQRKGAHTLPLSLNESGFFKGADFHGHQLFLSDLHSTMNGMVGDFVFSVVTPENQVLNFSGRNIPISEAGVDLCQMFLHMEGDISTDDPEFPITIKGSMNLDSASYVSFNCDGFDRFQLLCEYRFPANLLKPVDVNHNSVRAFFKIVSTEIGNFIGTVSIDPFEIKGLDDVQFSILNAVIDYSISSNDESMMSSINPEWPQQVKDKYQDDSWRGFFLADFSIGLPEGLANTSGGRISIAVHNFLADHGSGITGLITGNPSVAGNVSGWGMSLDSLALEVITNSVNQFSLSGKINIPILEGNATYQAMFDYPNGQQGGKAEIGFNLDLDGVYHIPYLNNSSLTLDQGSSASISYIGGKFQPQATLNGQIEVSISAPDITLPTLEFQGLKINDQTIPSFGDVQGKVTGGLDRLSVVAFGLAGMGLDGDNNSTGYLDAYHPEETVATLDQLKHGPNPQSISFQNDGDTGSGNPGQKLGGFPITIRNIGLHSAQDGNESCYKLDFNIGINFAKGVNAFNADGGFSIWGKLDFNKILTTEPWKALSYQKTTVNEIIIDADLGRIAIKGGVKLIDDDPVYGNGFKGAISMKVKFPTAECMIQSVGQFGNAPGDFRYFFVDAEAGFKTGLQLGNTGLSIYGFSGGFFYNMQRQGASPEEVAASKNIDNMPPNSPPILSDELLQPGISLSGTRYIPHEHNTGMQAGMIFGLSVPQTFVADVAFGMEVNTSSGFAVQRIYFEGGGYAMNQGLSQRHNASAIVRVKLDFDVPNSTLVGRFGMQFTSPFGSPPELAMIKGTYNANLSAVNVYFKFKGKKEYFVYAGTPDNPMKIQFQLTDAIKLSGVNAYFMIGTEMPSIPTLAQVFTQEGYDLPSELVSVSSRPYLIGDRGVAFGARLNVPKKNYRFLMFKASIRAMAGFDASMQHYDENITCGSNGSFGMNNWYLQGQAYGAFKGDLSMKINLLFYSTTVKIASLEAGAALQVKLPNPTWMMGFIFGRYSVLGGRIKGKFSFKVEMGEQCSDMPEYDPLANIPLIQDVYPTDGSNNEVYDSPQTTFFLPMNQTINISYIDDKGKEKIKLYKCFINAAETRITKKGTNITIPYNIIYRDSFSTAVFQPKNLLQANTNYEFKVRVGWKEIKGTSEIIGTTYEERKVSFRTGDKPQKIMTEAVAYTAPGAGQRYWHKNYARPMIEFKQQGWDYLFPPTRQVSFKTRDQNVITAFQNDGWNIVQQGDSSKISKNLPLKYICRIMNIKTNEVHDITINEHPAPPSGPSYIWELRYINFGAFSIPIYLYVPNTVTGTKVRFDELNTLNLTKEGIYGLQILRTPADPIQIPVSTIEVTNKDTYTYNDTLEVATVETTSREISSVNYLQQVIQAQTGDEVLYTDHYFGVSHYDHLKDKFDALTYGEWKLGHARNDFGYPDSQLPRMEYQSSSVDIYNGFKSPQEPFDYYDQIYLKNNIEQRTDGDYGNPIKDYIINQRKPIELVDLVGDRANKYVKQIRRILAKNDTKAAALRSELSILEKDIQRTIIPIDLYFPRNDDDKVYSDQTGVLLVENNTPAFWYKFKKKRWNDTKDGTRISFNDYYSFTQKVISDYSKVKGWVNQIYFNPHIVGKLTQSEINNKKMNIWNPSSHTPGYNLPGGPESAGNMTMWIENGEARIIRNWIRLYQYHAEYLDLLSRALIISKEQLYTYRLLRNYYLIPDYPYNGFIPIKSDFFADNRLNLLKQKKLGYRIKYMNSGAPEYFNSEGNKYGNTKLGNRFWLLYNYPF